MSLLSTIGLWVGGLLVGIVLGSYLDARRRRPSATEESRRVARTMPPHVNCRSTMAPLSTDGSGQTISGTWTGFSGTETSTTRAEPRDGPEGFRGPDLDDRDVDEWLRKWGLSGYE